MSPFLELPEEGSHLGVRVSAETRARLDRLVTTWQKIAEAQGRDEDRVKAINQAYVLRLLINKGIDTAFHELGGEPKSDDQLKQMVSAHAASHKKK
jgi:hypothetical protein